MSAKPSIWPRYFEALERLHAEDPEAGEFLIAKTVEIAHAQEDGDRDKLRRAIDEIRAYLTERWPDIAASERQREQVK